VDWLCYYRFKGSDLLMSMPKPDAAFSPESSEKVEPPDGFEGDVPAKTEKQTWGNIWDNLLRLGLGETALRLGTGIASIVLILLVIWVMNGYYLKGALNTSQSEVLAASLPTPTQAIQVMDGFPAPEGAFADGVIRLAMLHTTQPTHPRADIAKYIVQKGDTIFGISEKFNLKPETILWGNYYTLGDDPHRLKPGQELVILPVNGVYYKWNAGDGLNGVAKFYGVKPEDIIDWSGNQLTREGVGDFSHPNIQPGTFLVVPGGKRDFITWSAPRITRQNPSVAKIMGPGACGQIAEGPLGTGMFIFPTTEHTLSGYDYSPETNHRGLDYGGKLGNSIFAVDNGVVVYAGWNKWGYGNVVVIDHGDGWQSLYAHLSTLNVGCGSYVYQGDVIGAVGSTGNSSGPHLHFELMSDQYGRVNPKNFVK
jgi:hypothetical protein